MINYVNWLYESSVFITGTVFIYQLFLKSKTTFTFNRFFLLSGLIFALLLPFFRLNLFSTSSVNDDFAVLMAPVTIVSGDVKTLFTAPAFKWPTARIIYSIGVMLFLIRVIHGLIKLGFWSRKAVFARHGRFKVAYLPGSFSPFSFFNLVFIGQNDYTEEEINQIIAHEISHSVKWHSADVILLESVLIFQWFNPFVWILRRNLKEIHEFQADRAVLHQGVSPVNYKKLLLYQRTGARLELVNSFHKSFIKKRFIMMSKNNNTSKRTTLFATIALLTFFIGFMACNQTEENARVAESGEVLKSDSETDVYDIVDQMPKFPGGDKALGMFLINNTNYPDEAVQNKLEGRVYIKFIIDEKGKVTEPEIVRSSGHPILDEEALRVISVLPDWTPGSLNGEAVNVNYTVPINFQLSSESKSSPN
ncbi:M56 family metallopeptidase [Marinilabilia salmonicolor]|uniref:M56 family metallopeptidase n=1 Tax=Marinilabilia salmonicolor TaxID=989 RepID=UPI000299E59D|nr:M56 family metallopeptidase [Marinilabilia salmonicolor]